MSKILDQMKEVDRLAGETKDCSDRIMEVKETVVGCVGAAKKGMSGDVTALIKIVPMFTDSKKFAGDMADLALECVKKAIEMADKCASAKKSIPCIGCMGKGKSVAPDDEDGADPDPANVDEDITQLEKIKEAFESGSMMTMVKEGAECVTSLEEKIPIIQVLVDAIIKFCKCILKITSAMKEMSLSKMAKTLPQILRCLDLSAMVQQFAEELKRFVEVLRDVFEAMANKVDGFNPAKMAGNAASAVTGAVGGAIGSLF